MWVTSLSRADAVWLITWIIDYALGCWGEHCQVQLIFYSPTSHSVSWWTLHTQPRPFEGSLTQRHDAGLLKECLTPLCCTRLLSVVTLLFKSRLQSDYFVFHLLLNMIQHFEKEEGERIWSVRRLRFLCRCSCAVSSTNNIQDKHTMQKKIL